MLVYCLLGAVDYEGYSLLGVYASEEEAQAAHAVQLQQEYDCYDRYYVELRELGAPAADRGLYSSQVVVL